MPGWHATWVATIILSTVLCNVSNCSCKLNESSRANNSKFRLTTLKSTSLFLNSCQCSLFQNSLEHSSGSTSPNVKSQKPQTPAMPTTPSSVCIFVVFFGMYVILGKHSMYFINSVSYTHLTLPTNREV